MLGWAGLGWAVLIVMAVEAVVINLSFERLVT
jgi:hypothetical protein